jgi:small neutral amino acid transporter SnatA (MarC family)
VTALSSAELAQLLPSEAETLTLREEKRGIYSIPIATPSIAGSYAFEVVLDWTDPRTGHVHREERLEEFAGVRK